MNIHYKIVEVYPEESQIVVRFWSDNITEMMLAADQNRKEDGTPVRCRTDVAIDVPYPEPKGEELETLILKTCPYGWIKRLEDMLNPEIDTSISECVSKLNVVSTVDQETLDSIFSADTSGDISEDEIEKLIASLEKTETV